jgi:hypothetical protein
MGRNIFTHMFLTAISLLILSIALIGCSKQSEPSTSFTNNISDSSSTTKTTAANLPSAGQKATGTTAGKPGSTAGAAAGNVIRLKTISFIDQDGTGTEAFKMLIPTDWQYEGGIQWIMDPPNMPAVSQFRVWNPKGTEEFRVFPSQAFYWTDNPLTAQLFPTGSKYFGNEVRELLNPLDALKQIVIPRFLGDVQRLEVINEQDISDLIPTSEPTQDALPTSRGVGKIRVEYQQNGLTYEDEIYCAVEATYMPTQTMSGTQTNIMWGVNYICSFKAEKGKLDASGKILQTISDSVTVNLQWFNTYVQVIEYLIKMKIQQINSIGQLGSIIAQTGSEIRQENLDAYYQREEMNDRVSQQFSEYMRGVDSYYNPLEEKNVELPTGYDNVWVNGNGEYVLSDNPNYNPNIENNQNFQRLEKAKP